MRTSWRRWVFFFLSATRWMTSVKGSHWHAVLPHVTQTHWSQGLRMQIRSHELNKPLLFKLVSMGHLDITKTQQKHLWTGCFSCVWCYFVTGDGAFLLCPSTMWRMCATQTDRWRGTVSFCLSMETLLWSGACLMSLLFLFPWLSLRSTCRKPETIQIL